MKIIQNTVIKLCLIFLFIPFLLHGQDLDNDIRQIELDSVVIYTSRMPINRIETGRNISIIESKAIEDLPVNSVDELLRYLPGFEAQSRNGFGVQSDFIIRGSTFNQVLVVIDGVRMNDPLTGHFNSYIPVSPAEIERIEILRGPASSIYGADAVGGVVNIITKTFSMEQQENSAYAESRIGQNDLFTLNMGGYTRKGNLDISGGYQTNHSSGEELPTGVNNYFKVHTASLSLAYNFKNDWKLAARGGYAYRDFSAQYFYTRSEFDLSTEEVENWWSQTSLMKKKGNSITDIDISFKQTKDVFEFNPAFPSINEHRTRQFITQLNRFTDLNSDWRISYGLQVDNRNILSNDRGNHNDWHMGAYGILDYSGIRNLIMNLSLRADYDENYDFELSPQFNISYVLNKWLFRGSVGRGIRAPDYTERFISTNLEGPLTPGRNLGNPNLKAETSWTYEAGVDYQIASGVKIITTFFGRSSENLIDYVITNSNDIPNNGNLVPDSDYFYATNIENATTTGFEAELWISKYFNSKSNLVTTFGYTFLNTNTDSGTVSKYISNHARDLFTGSLVYKLGRWDIGINGLFKARDEDRAEAINEDLEPNYTVWNLKTSFRVINNLRIKLEVLNLFDEQYADILGARMPGRWISAGLSWSLK